MLTQSVICMCCLLAEGFTVRLSGQDTSCKVPDFLSLGIFGWPGPGEDLPASSLECIHLAAHVLEAGCLNRHHLIAQMVKNMPDMEETQILSLGWEDILEKAMATHSSIAWRISWTEEPGRLQSMWLQRVRHNWATNTILLLNFHKLLFSAPHPCHHQG